MQVVEAGTGALLPGMLVELIGANDRVLQQGLTNADGRRFFPLARTGEYRIRVRRIGFNPVVGPPVVALTLDTIATTITASLRRTTLDAMAVSARRCSRDAFSDPTSAALWENIRAALTTAVLTRDEGVVTAELRAFRRQLDPERRVVSEFVGLPRLIEASRPYASLPPDDLERGGYMRVTSTGPEFHAPDERVLLSDEFVASHCFEVIRGSDATAGLLGVRFTPAERRGLNDIAGTLWVDPQSVELRYLDYWYLIDRMPRSAIGEDRSGGQVLFTRLPNGLWMVSAWRLRMPRFDDNAALDMLSGVQGFEEFGGVVTPVGGDSTHVPSTVELPYRALLAPSRITGEVYDSLAGRPLFGARAWLVPIEGPAIRAAGLAPRGLRMAVEARADTADRAGGFHIENVPAGTYRLGIVHAALDSLGIIPTEYEILVRPGTRVNATLAIPSLAGLARGCARPAGMSTGEHGGVIIGSVLGAGDQAPLVNATVRASWVNLSRRRRRELSTSMVSVDATTDSVGNFRICGAPDSTVVVVQAAGPTVRSGEVRTTVNSFGLAQVNIRLAETGEGEPALASSIVSGVVTDSLGNAISGAEVRLDNANISHETDVGGFFRFVGVQPGTRSLEVRRIGAEPVLRSFDVLAGDSTAVTVSLARMRTLDAMRVTAQRPISTMVEEVVARHKSGRGYLLTQDKIRQQRTVSGMLQMVPGVRLAAGGMGDSNQWVALMRSMAFTGRTECIARVFMEGRETDYNEIESLAPDQIGAIEIFPRPGMAPLFTRGRSIMNRDDTCGVLVFWMIHS